MPLTASELLTVWEHGAAAPPGRRALELAGLARPGLAAGERDTLTAGERDAALFDLRERVFGSAIEAVVACTGCGETLELASAIDELRTEGAPEDTAESRTLSHAGYEIVFRLPTALDLAEIAHEIDLGRAHDDLLGRCVLEASVEGQAIEARELPDDVVGALDAALAAADPQADLELAVECPTCGHSSVTHFDIASFLWLELERFALETLREVHVLAVAYGWSESQILALGARRRLYLELIDG